MDTNEIKIRPATEADAAEILNIYAPYITDTAITFEQSWKMMKEILEIHGFAEGATSSPKMILRTAYKAGMIKDEELWLSALQERNNVTHSYNRKIAMGIITQAKQKFYKMFCELKEEIDRNWI